LKIQNKYKNTKSTIANIYRASFSMYVLADWDQYLKYKTPHDKTVC